jgi:putative transposase
MLLSYKYQLQPTHSQMKSLEFICEEQRVLYNAALQERIDCYSKTNKPITYYNQCKSLKDIEQNIPVNLQRWTLSKLDISFKAFFKRLKSKIKAGFPRYRAKSRWKSFGFAEFSGIRLKENKLYFKGLVNGLKIHLHRPIGLGDITGCVFTKTDFGWYVSIQVKSVSPPKKEIKTMIGIDMGLIHLATLSNGVHIPNIRTTKRYERKLRIRQRQISRCHKGSNRRKKIKLSIARIHRKITNTRDTYLHQITNDLVNRYDLIAVEQLNIKGMIQSNLAKSISDAAWNKFIQYLDYKAERAGSQVRKANAWRSSQECSGCGTFIKKGLSVRIHICYSCGLVMDRDENAAINILNRAVVSPELANVINYDMRLTGDFVQ